MTGPLCGRTSPATAPGSNALGSCLLRLSKASARKGVWIGFGSVAINVVSGLVFTLVVASEASDALGDDAGGFFASLGLALVGIQAVCCSAVVALPLLMNGADLE